MANASTVTQNANIRPKLYVKQITSNFEGIKAPYYVPSEVMPEGSPVVRRGATGPTFNVIRKAAAGEGRFVIGFAAQFVYDDSGWGPLANTHLPNNSGQRLNGMPIGVFMGRGWAEVRNYIGAVNPGDPVYFDPETSKLVTTGHASAVEGNELPAVFEGSGTDGDKPVRISFDFSDRLAAVPVPPQGG